MRTAVQITDEKGEHALCQLVSSHGLVADESLDASREIAIEILREEAFTDEAIEALGAACKKRWWNSKRLREAAAEARQAVETRIAMLDEAIDERQQSPSSEQER